MAIHRTPTQRRAFTLIELLVVVSIIALLVAILLPTVGKAKAEAMRATCGTRMHALGIAMQTYLSSWDDRYPVNGVILPKTNVPDMYATNPTFANAKVDTPDMWRFEFGALFPYMGGTPPAAGYTLPLPPSDPSIAKAYLCPADDLQRTGVDNPGSTDNLPLIMQPQATGYPLVVRGPGAPGYWSYSVNSVLNSLGRFRNNFAVGTLPWSDPLRQGAIRRPMEFVTFVEEANESKFNDEVMDAPAYSGGSGGGTTSLNTGDVVDRLTDRHRNMGNVLFGDWHFESFNAIIFNYVPQAQGSSSHEIHTTAMQSSITRMFFPDYGDFAASYTAP